LFAQCLKYGFFFTAVLCGLIAPKKLYALTLEVSGWGPVEGLNLSGKLPSWLGDDPVIGRLACPALVRLEGDHLKNGALLLKSLPAVERTAVGDRWVLSLRPGLKWWTGTAVDADGLAGWLREELPRIIQERVGVRPGQTPVITVISSSMVSIQWQGAQRFGPYVMAGYSFSRPKDGRFECVGLYAAQTVPEGIDLTLNSGYTAIYSKIYLRSESQPSLAVDHRMRFLLAAQAAGQKSEVTKIAGPSRLSCQAKMEIPLISALVWNPASTMASTPALRRGLTMATPRGDILRTAAAELGSLVSAPLLRVHPGYNPRNLVKPFNLVAASDLFEAAGLKQPHIGLPRAKIADKGISLRIARGSGRQELIEKMLGDAYASAGIETQFEDLQTSGGTYDGVLVSLFIPWTSHDIYQVLHGPFPFAEVSDKSLTEAAEAYAYSLTHEKPDFGLLRHVHDKWVEVEPWTVLMAHQYCVTGQGVKVPPKINTLDPDWFRRLTVD
jgi:hypothetical protein